MFRLKYVYLIKMITYKIEYSEVSLYFKSELPVLCYIFGISYLFKIIIKKPPSVLCYIFGIQVRTHKWY